jgi:hypothetical protein
VTFPKPNRGRERIINKSEENMPDGKAYRVDKMWKFLSEMREEIHHDEPGVWMIQSIKNRHFGIREQSRGKQINT